MSEPYDYDGEAMGMAAALGLCTDRGCKCTMSDEVDRARAVLAAASPLPWSDERDGCVNGYIALRDGEGVAIEEAFGDCCRAVGDDDEETYPSEPETRAIVLAVNALGPLLDVLEACVRRRHTAEEHASALHRKAPDAYDRGPDHAAAIDAYDDAIDRALAALREAT